MLVPAERVAETLRTRITPRSYPSYRVSEDPQHVEGRNLLCTPRRVGYRRVHFNQILVVEQDIDDELQKAKRCHSVTFALSFASTG